MKIANTVVSPTIEGLTHAIEKFAQSDGDYKTAIPALSLHRREKPSEPLHCIFNLGLGVVAQGSKQAMVGDEVINYSQGQSMLTAIDLPVISRVTRASRQKPLLGLMLTLDPLEIAQVAGEMKLPMPSRDTAFHTVSIESLDDRLIADLVRLVDLLEQPQLAPLLAPLINREIIIRLLAGPHGPHLQRLVAEGSPSLQISKAVSWLKKNFAQPVQIDELASHVHMSPSTFRQHFRAITGTSPLQYQKLLRLQEARQLMLLQNMNATSASGQVGYESTSQFSREYDRLFGLPPQQDIKSLRLTPSPAMEVSI